MRNIACFLAGGITTAGYFIGCTKFEGFTTPNPFLLVGVAGTVGFFALLIINCINEKR